MNTDVSGLVPGTEVVVSLQPRAKSPLEPGAKRLTVTANILGNREMGRGWWLLLVPPDKVVK